MAQIDFSHTVDIMKAATPFFDPSTRRSMDLFTKFFDLLGCYRNFRLPLEMASNESYNNKLDIEGLLTGIRPKLSERELPLVDQILGFFNAKRMFETYSAYMEMMKNMEGFNNGDSETDGNTNFDMFSVLNSFMNNNSSADVNSDIDENENSDFNSYMDSDGNYKGDLDTENTSDNSSSGFDFSSFASLFGDMVSPEQASNFENLSMLLKNMSYDGNNDNSDSNDNNDHNDNNDDESNQ